MNELVYKEEAYKIIGICMDIHNILGGGFLEIVYKDAIEFELRKQSIIYEREKQFDILYKGTTLPHKYFADFIVFDKIILEVKAVEGIADEFLKQTINYLAVSKCNLGLIVNFGRNKLTYKRVVL
jgi:GxxExxY protein